MRIKQAFSIASFLLLMATNSYAETETDTYRYPFYFGVSAGYGATTWNELVSKDATAAMLFSTPTQTHENGIAWGVFGGYEIMPTFAIEGSFTRFPSARIYFDDMSLFAFDYNATAFSSKTTVVTLSGKFMVLIPRTSLRAFAGIGAAEVHRDDFIDNAWLLTPTVSTGLNYNLTERIMLELGVNVNGGNGQSELDPAEHYIPFTYSVFTHLAYRF